MKSKTEIRREIAGRRKALTEAFKETSSAAIINRLAESRWFAASSTIALYMYFGGEVRLDALFPICWEQARRTCIPVYNATRKLYEMAEITPDTTFIEGHYGIREPRSYRLIPMSDIDLIAVPGVAFDQSGNRLGRGGGFYDRMLSGCPGYKIAVAFDFQIYPEIPTEPHDLPVDAILSEIKTLKY